MADAKLTALTADTSPTKDDLLYTVNDPAGTPASRKTTIENFFKVINDLTTDSSPDRTADYIVTYDASATAAKKVLVSSIAGSGDLYNYLINGGFDFFQRVDPTASTAMSDDAYDAPDRWYSLIQGANATIKRDTGIGTSAYSVRMTAGGTTNRYGLAQIIESVNSKPLRGQTVIAQVKVKPTNNAGSGTRDYRIAILEWTGTADTVTSEVVNDWTSSTYTTGNFFTSTTLTLVGTAAVTATHGAESTLSVSGAVSTSCNNLIVFFWAEDVPTHASDYAQFGEAGLYIASTAQTWKPRLIADELVLCLRYFEIFAPASFGGAYPAMFTTFSTTDFRGAFAFAVQKRTSPTTTVSGITGTTQGIIAQVDGNLAVSSVNATDVNTKTAMISFVIATASGTAKAGLLLDGSNANSSIKFSAEL